jgi:hypothetical protein
MKFLTATAIAALSLAAVTPALANVAPAARATVEASGTALAPANPAQLLLAQRRGKCTEDLGYGRTGSYGCG